MNKFKLSKKDAQLIVDAICSWEQSLFGRPPDCPLCKEYMSCGDTSGEGRSWSCTDCPVRRYTGCHNCTNTPYWEHWRTFRKRKEEIIKFGTKMLDEAGYEIGEE